jgi:hypothetical protein
MKSKYFARLMTFVSRPRLLRAALVFIAGELVLTPASLAQSNPAPVSSQQRQRAAYEEALASYRKAQDLFAGETDKYWEKIHTQQLIRRSKRAAGSVIAETDYVLQQPPEYSGPPAPKLPDFMVKRVKASGALREAIALEPAPAIADLLAAAKTQYGFVPRAADEKEYMLAFAREALQAGLSAEQVVGVYSLETGGLGPYSRLSGVLTVNNQCQPVMAQGKPAASLALGYAQLLPANTAATAHGHAQAIAEKLLKMAENAPKGKAIELRSKAALFQRMVDDVNKWLETYTGPKDNWQEYVIYGRTKNGRAMHALLLDADIGPALQVYKLAGIVTAAARHGIGELSSAQLELLNLVGDGRGLDALAPAAKNAPAANFFDRSGYEANPVAKGQTASSLLTRLGAIIGRHKRECGSKRFFEAFETASREPPKRPPTGNAVDRRI